MIIPLSLMSFTALLNLEGGVMFPLPGTLPISSSYITGSNRGVWLSYEVIVNLFLYPVSI